MSLSKSNNMKRHVLEDIDWTSERKKKRKESTSSRKMTSQNSRSSSNKEKSFSKHKCMNWFGEYASGNTQDKVIGPEGIERFCNDLGVQPEDSVMLVLSWTMEANRMGYFTQMEWFTGMEKLGCDNMEKLKSKLSHLRSQLQHPQSFREIFRFSFDFAREEDHRSLELDTSKALLSILLGEKWKLLGSFLTYLDHQKQYRVINKDQWYNIHEFSHTIKQDLSNYDPNGAWPVILDEFVEWMEEQNQSDQHNHVDNN